MFSVKMINLKRNPFHVFLLPIYFISSKYIQYEGLPGVGAAVKSCLLLLLLSGLLYIGFRKIIDQKLKASLITSACMFIILFFGDIRVFFQRDYFSYFLSQYRFLLPLITVLSLLFIKIIKKEPFQIRTTFFLNTLILVLISIETLQIFNIHNTLKRNKEAAKVQVKKASKNTLPDIYYIVPDCYPSSSYQQEVLGVGNSSFEDSLRKNDFYIFPNSSSNYNRTIFSMLSVFNMDYLDIVDSVRKADARAYALAIRDIESAQLFNYLNTAGYKTVNLSIFDVAGTKALKKETFLAASTEEIFFSHTFWNYFIRDIYYTWIVNKKLYRSQITRKNYQPLKAYNQQLIDTLSQALFANKSAPVFVYAHLYMPHYPYFFNEAGQANAEDSIYGRNMITDKKRFSGYIQYTNKQLLRIIHSIKTKTNGKAVIIIQSDHGIADLDIRKQDDAFRNFTSLYFPDKDYKELPDTISNVNTFRIVLNKYLQQNFPMLKKTSFTVKLR